MYRNRNRWWPGLFGASVVLSAAGMLGALSACAQLDRNAHADALAETAHLKRELVDGGPFVLTAYSRITQPAQPLRVYIEGDGLAWISRTTPSLDPTPREATALALAAQDPGLNVVYLARPCQFTPKAQNPRCDIQYWTGKRFAPEIIQSMNDAVNHFSALAPGQPLELVGYSAGGAVAVLIAARRNDVVSIRTVAGNLDDEYVNRIHGVSPMPESENPIDAAPRLSTVPQIHFSGANDAVVPPEVAQRFIKATGVRCARAIVIPGASHDGDWEQHWAMLLTIEPTCTAIAPNHK